jgi:2-polyprenyl-3-methyl-5-hydroxy-6-metoxy-1,4-benzoquinol methylase
MEREDSGIASGEESQQTPFEKLSARVRNFYEEHPFPNYDGFESVGDLLARASRSVYAAMLDRQIPVGARVLEVGCGTGQLGAFLSVGGRAVVGVDMCRASLRLANKFKTHHGLKDCNFLHASLFDLPLRSESFDLVICKGVLHHTPDARAGTAAILRMLRPGGYFICGLYNKIGRIPTSLRRLWFRAARSNPASLDMVLRTIARSDAKAKSWFLDQYANPHETRHGIDEVFTWFEENDVEYLNCVPPIALLKQFDSAAPLFAPAARGTRLTRLLTQLKWVFTISREGALFDMIGRKRAKGAGRS